MGRLAKNSCADLSHYSADAGVQENPLREFFEKVGISDDLGLSQNSELLLHFF